MNKPKVSIVVPNYNHVQFLNQRLKSIFNQSFSNFEIIILDDCSTDDSVNILKKYKSHEKVSHFLINKSNSGSPFHQWQKGIELAKGEYIWIAESDDWCDPEFLSIAMANITKQNAHIFFCASMFYYQHEKITTPAPDSKINWIKTGHELLFSGLLEYNVLRNASAIVFKKSLIIEFPEKIKSFKVAGDWLLWVTLSLKPNVKIIYSSKKLNYFRLHSNSAVSKRKNQQLGIYEGLHVLIEAKKSKLFKKNKLITKKIFNYWYDIILNNILKNIKEHKIKNIIQLIITTMQINIGLGLKIIRSFRFYYFLRK